MDIKSPSEDLYLAKISKFVKKDVLVAKQYVSQLHQHQIEGLRYMYKQFRKKKSGIILNDATGYGKKTQVILFVNAIKDIVKEPILILCNDIELQKWKRSFLKWSDDLEDVLFESNKLYSEARIFVSSFEDISMLSKRNWSIVVVDDPVSLKKFRTLKNVTAGFKLWVVSIDMKAHLNTFSAINDWINPTKKFCAEQFEANANDVQDILSKAILLDTYFEEIVLRRGTSSLDDEKHISPVVTPKKAVIKKNKDPTGTKVKRSKRRIVSDDEMDPIAKINSNATLIRNNKDDFRLNESNTINYQANDHESDKTNGIEAMETSSLINTSEMEEGRESINTINKNENKSNLEYVNDSKLEIDVGNETELKINDKDQDAGLPEDTEDSSVYELSTIPIPDINIQNIANETDLKQNNRNETEDLAGHSQELHLKYVADDFPTSLHNNSDVDKSNSTNESANESKLDEKLRDLEEEAANKFKGSLLDSLLQTDNARVKKKSTVKPVYKLGNHEAKTTTPKPNITIHKQINTKIENENNYVSPKKVKEEISENHEFDFNSSKESDLEEKIKDLEKETYNKFRGSVLDSLF